MIRRKYRKVHHGQVNNTTSMNKFTKTIIQKQKNLTTKVTDKMLLKACDSASQIPIKNYKVNSDFKQNFNNQQNRRVSQVLSKLKAKYQNRSQMYELYKFFDTKNQGKIQTTDLQIILPKFGFDVSHEEINQIHKEMTKTGQDNISLADFVKFIKEESPPKQSKLQYFYKQHEKQSKFLNTNRAKLQSANFPQSKIKTLENQAQYQPEAYVVKMRELFNLTKAQKKAMNRISNIQAQSSANKTIGFQTKNNQWFQHSYGKQSQKRFGTKVDVIQSLDQQRAIKKQRYENRLNILKKNQEILAQKITTIEKNAPETFLRRAQSAVIKRS